MHCRWCCLCWWCSSCGITEGTWPHWLREAALREMGLVQAKAVTCLEEAAPLQPGHLQLEMLPLPLCPMEAEVGTPQEVLRCRRAVSVWPTALPPALQHSSRRPWVWEDLRMSHLLLPRSGLLQQMLSSRITEC